MVIIMVLFKLLTMFQSMKGKYLTYIYLHKPIMSETTLKISTLLLVNRYGTIRKTEFTEGDRDKEGS